MGKSKKNASDKKNVSDTGTSTGAGILGLAAFIVACFAGLYVGVEPATLLLRAIGCLMVGALIGAFLGRAGDALVKECVDQHKSANPIPERPAELGGVDEVSEMKKGRAVGSPPEAGGKAA